MKKTEKELDELKQKVGSMANKLSELTDEELSTIASGTDFADFWEVLKKMGKGMHSVTEPVTKTVIPPLTNKQ